MNVYNSALNYATNKNILYTMNKFCSIDNLLVIFKFDSYLFPVLSSFNSPLFL